MCWDCHWTPVQNPGAKTGFGRLHGAWLELEPDIVSFPVNGAGGRGEAERRAMTFRLSAHDGVRPPLLIGYHKSKLSPVHETGQVQPGVTAGH